MRLIEFLLKITTILVVVAGALFTVLTVYAVISHGRPMNISVSEAEAAEIDARNAAKYRGERYVEPVVANR